MGENCVKGVTNRNSWYYTDCCGDYQEGTQISVIGCVDLTQPNDGISLMGDTPCIISNCCDCYTWYWEANFVTRTGPNLSLNYYNCSNILTTMPLSNPDSKGVICVYNGTTPFWIDAIPYRDDSLVNQYSCCEAPITCGLGLIRESQYYYTDCCGEFIRGSLNPGESLEVSFNYTLPNAGVVELNVTSNISCSTPTPTPTPTVTPTNTATPTPTPTNTVTPTPSITPPVTPSNTPVTVLKNECDVITLFEMGISCNVIQSPTESNPDGGILSINVTGGTAPYSFFWDGGQRDQTLSGISGGSYEVIVRDYAWPDGNLDSGISDYTATIICELIGPSPTSTPTMTPTPTSTQPIQCVELCMIITDPILFGPAQFVCNGVINGQFSWVATVNGKLYYIIWSPTNNKFIVYQDSGATTPLSLNRSIVATEVLSPIPVAGWQFYGGTSNGNITVTTDSCPDVIPLQVNFQSENSSCQGTTNCNGIISMFAQNGVPPYEYSINGGITYSTNNIFTNLCPNIYSVIARDSLNESQISSVTIGYDSVPVTYQLSLANVSPATTTSVPNVSQTVTQTMTLVVTPPLPVGVSVTFNLLSTALRTVNGPGSATSSVIWNITKNGSSVNTTVGPTTQVSQGTRPFCSPNTQTVTSTDYSSSITITNGDIINITSTTVDTITNGQVASQSNCTTNIITQVSSVISTPTILGNTCSSVIGSSRQVQSNEFTYVPGTTNPCPNCEAQDITIGTQTWSKCNLNVTTYRNGDTIPQVTDPAVWSGLTTGAWCYYNNDPANNAIYGKLYNWYAVNDPRGLAPTGYHIPTDAEWTTLTTYLGGTPVAGGKMKETGFCHWLSPNTDATNESGFTGLPGGTRGDNGTFVAINLRGDWWSSSEFNSSTALPRILNYSVGTAITGNTFKYYGNSVRLIKD